MGLPGKWQKLNGNEVRTRLHAAGLWKDCLGRKRQLMDEGATTSDATFQAYSEYMAKARELEEAGEIDISDPVEGLKRVTGTIKAKKASEKAAPARSVVQWVAMNMAVEKVDLSTAPDTSAIAMLKFARASAMNEANFWTQFAKLLPSKAQLEQEARFRDDGRDVDNLIDRIQAQSTSAR